MERARTLFMLALVLAGCGRSTSLDSSVRPLVPVEVTVISGFADEPVLVGPSGFRIGSGYYDFSAFDSIKISFTARRAEPGTSVVPIAVRVGPSTMCRDSLLTAEKRVAVVLSKSDLPKPFSSALTIYAENPDAPLLLSELRVIGVHW